MYYTLSTLTERSKVISKRCDGIKKLCFTTWQLCIFCCNFKNDLFWVILVYNTQRVWLLLICCIRVSHYSDWQRKSDISVAPGLVVALYLLLVQNGWVGVTSVTCDNPAFWINPLWPLCIRKQKEKFEYLPVY